MIALTLLGIAATIGALGAVLVVWGIVEEFRSLRERIAMRRIHDAVTSLEA